MNVFPVCKTLDFDASRFYERGAQLYTAEHFIGDDAPITTITTDSQAHNARKIGHVLRAPCAEDPMLLFTLDLWA